MLSGGADQRRRLDRRNGMALSQSGVLRLSRGEGWRLSEFATVVLGVATDSDGDPTRPVRLEGQNDVVVELEGGARSAGQRRLGEEFAAFLLLSFTDCSFGSLVVHQPEQRDDNLRDTTRQEVAGGVSIRQP